MKKHPHFSVVVEILEQGIANDTSESKLRASLKGMKLHPMARVLAEGWFECLRFYNQQSSQFPRTGMHEFKAQQIQREEGEGYD